jgi:gluconokinase
MVIVLMGVSGAGKTTVGRALAAQLGWSFHDADDLHDPASIARMRGGRALDDEQRGPWLAALAGLIRDHLRHDRSMVLACSALSSEHRARLLEGVPPGADVRLVHLHASRDVLARRLTTRPGHFFPADLLDSQLATLEVPEHGGSVPVLSVDATRPVADLVAAIRAAFGI